MQTLILVSEPGMYRALAQRRMVKTLAPATKERIARFQRWAYHDVFPSIRRTGGYALPSAPAATAVGLLEALRDPEQVLALVAHHAQQTLAARAEAEAEKVAHAETYAHLEQEVRLRQIESRRAETAGRALVVATQRIEEQAPKAEAFDAVVAKGDAMSVRDAANILGIGQNELYAFLRDRDGRVPWLYVLPGTTDERPFRYRVKQGHLKPRIVTIPRSDGTTQHRHQPLVTPKGLDVLRRDFPVWAAARARVADREPRLDGI